MMQFILSSELTEALRFIKNHPEYKKTIPWLALSEQQRTVIKSAWEELKVLISSCVHADLQSSHLKFTMGRYQSSGKVFPHIWGAIIPEEVSGPSRETCQLYIGRDGEHIKLGICLSDAAKLRSDIVKAMSKRVADLEPIFAKLCSSEIAKGKWSTVVSECQIAVSTDPSSLSNSDMESFATLAIGQLFASYLRIAESMREAGFLEADGSEDVDAVSDQQQATITPSDSDTRFWKISCGVGGKFSGVHREFKRISIGWAEKDLSQFGTKDAMHAYFEEQFKNTFDPGHATRQSWSFSHEIRLGDFVFGYGSASVLLIGKVTRGYRFENPEDWAPSLSSKLDRDHWHTLGIEWFSCPVVKKAELSSSLQKRLGTVQTILELTESEAKEILSAVGLSSDSSQTMSTLPPPEPEIRALKSAESIAREYGLSLPFVENFRDRLEKKKQIILQGPPGTGKTLVANAVAEWIQPLPSRVRRVQFHPSYTYEDFVEGIRPRVDGRELGFEKRDGVFKDFCIEAIKYPNEKFVFIIDELNRGNLPLIFGELLSMIEYRDKQVTLPYSQSDFVIPANVLLICTMNTADRSIAIMDFAIRRRFDFISMEPNGTALTTYLRANNCKLDVSAVVNVFEAINSFVAERLGTDLRLGHSFWMKPDLDKNELESIWNHNVLPTLQEYFFDKPHELKDLTLDTFMRHELRKAG